LCGLRAEEPDIHVGGRDKGVMRVSHQRYSRRFKWTATKFRMPQRCGSG
jgi:hypothetical protein